MVKGRLQKKIYDAESKGGGGKTETKILMIKKLWHEGGLIPKAKPFFNVYF